MSTPNGGCVDQVNIADEEIERNKTKETANLPHKNSKLLYKNYNN